MTPFELFLRHSILSRDKTITWLRAFTNYRVVASEDTVCIVADDTHGTPTEIYWEMIPSDDRPDELVAYQTTLLADLLKAIS